MSGWIVVVFAGVLALNVLGILASARRKRRRRYVLRDEDLLEVRRARRAREQNAAEWERPQ